MLVPSVRFSSLVAIFLVRIFCAVTEKGAGGESVLVPVRCVMSEVIIVRGSCIDQQKDQNGTAPDAKKAVQVGTHMQDLKN